MHQVSANYTLPAVLHTLQPANANGLKKAFNSNAAANTGSAASTDPSGGLGTTFLNLLSTELQNQDPTAPVDSTAMVGQMISLNQLDQLISINQTLSASAGSGATATGGSSPSSGASPAAPLSNAISGANLAPSTPAAVNQLPFDPTTLMPLNFGDAAAAAASINSAITSGTTTNTSGGK